SLWSDASEAYVGHDGFLGRHRIKVYGYLELAFKVGRSLTIGGFSGPFKDRTWDRVDSELEYSRRERLESFPSSCHLADVRSGGEAATHAVAMRRVVLELGDASLRYEPGDRCGVLPENEEALVERTLAALRARGDERIELTPEWREHLQLRPNFAGKTWLTLRDLLRFGRIRPVIPRVAEALHAVTQHAGLGSAIVEQTTARWELWELLLDLDDSGFDVRRLWQGEVTSSGYLSRVVPPENFRMYSISSSMPEGAGYAQSVELTVGLVRYQSPSPARAPALVRAGTASSFLGAAPNGRARVPVIIQHPARFGLPEDPRAPLLMVAGGSGIGPFLSFIRKRSGQPDVGACCLYWGLRDPADLVYREELARAVASGRLALHVAFSRADVALQLRHELGGPARFELVAGERRRVDQLLLDESRRAELERWLASRADGGLGAYLYTCGRSGFARSVDHAFRAVLARAHGDGHERAVDQRLAALAAEGRYLREIYSDPRPVDATEPSFDVSELVTRNSESTGYWFVLDAKVYDLTSFMGMHPGGLSVLRGYAGMDATQGYLRAHRRATEVDAMRDMYALGKVRALDFRRESRLVERGGVTQRTLLATLYRAWLGFTYLAVEMQNALRNDLGLKNAVTARGEPIAPRSAYKIERLIETQERFLSGYTTGLAGAPAIELWELTEGMYRGRASSFMKDAVSHVHQSSSAKFAATLSAELRAELKIMLESAEPERARQQQRLLGTCEQLEVAAEDFVSQAKLLLREGLSLFERYEAAVLESAGAQLLQLLGGLPDALSGYLFDVQKRLHALGYRWVLEREPVAPTPVVGARRQVLAANRYWLLEWDGRRGVAFFPRSAEPLLDLADLVAENERVLAALRATAGCRGVVVDTRQAPPRNDPEFEAAMRGMRHELCRNYGRVAVLIVSAVGVLQVVRLGRDDDAPTLVTHSEDDAIQFAMGAS
ncbi:MAG TPA: cytochrome b5 domain-containing protein, partial [Polyangiaceae bacterium]|nr:cytochrome b5 domain-containing protein [Polyangiaceae bacterium]